MRITIGDIDFQNTLTELEKNYIHQGQNWISKGARETSLKALHKIGYTLDDLQTMPEDDQKKIWDAAREKWNNGSN